MTIKELAHSAQQYVQSTTGCNFKRAHVYELLAALFGFKSFAAFRSDALLSDSGIGANSLGLTPELIGRTVQLGYPQESATAIARAFADHTAARKISFVPWRDLLASIRRKTHVPVDDEILDDWETDLDGDLDDDPGDSAESSIEQQASLLRQSSLLQDGLEQAAGEGRAVAHFVIAALNRCGKPNGYLYEEAQKGRILNTVEQGWADSYLPHQVQYQKYRHHLRQAAVGGIREAAAEFAEVFGDAQFFALAERSSGDIDAWQMVNAAASVNNQDSRLKWMRVAAEQGSDAAIESLAQRGDLWALEKQAETGDLHAIRELAERTVETDLSEAWKWVYLAKMLGTDFTESNMRAYHDGGPDDGQEYDDDVGGPLYAAGNEGMELEPLDPEQDRVARRQALAFHNKIPDITPSDAPLDWEPRIRSDRSGWPHGRDADIVEMEVRKVRRGGENRQ